MSDPNSLRDRLAEPFDNVQWRLQQTHPKGLKPKYPPGTRGMFLAYIDARQLYERLDDVFGFGGWQRIVKQVNADGSVIVELRVKVGDEWISHEDIGYSNNPGEDHEKEPLKAAVSDGAKRCGVGIGIGRFLYELEPVWMEIDEWGKPLANPNTGELPERKRGTTVNTVPQSGSTANGVIQETESDATAEELGWTGFWTAARRAGLGDKASAEKAIGHLGADPAYAMERLQAWAHDTPTQSPMAAPEPPRAAGQSATPRQLKYIEVIAREMGLSDIEVSAEVEQLYGRPTGQLERRDASAFIERLQSRRNMTELAS